MNQKINSNKAYILSSKTPKFIITWLISVVIIVIITLIIMYKYSYSEYESYKGYVRGDSVVIYVKDDISKFIDYKMFIEKKEYQFKIKEISSDYYLIDNDNYYEVLLETNIEEKYMINNNVVNLTLVKNKTTLLKQIMKGLKLWKE